MYNVAAKEFTALDNSRFSKNNLESYKIIKNRIDHTTVLWNDDGTDKIVLYGGQDHRCIRVAGQEESKLKVKPIRNCIKDICIFNLRRREWELMEIKH